jgi:uncharacterized protein YecT (DUF1311 family)
LSLAALALAAAAQAVAASQGYGLSRTFQDCMNKSGGVTVEMRACSSDELKRQDERLNKAYEALQKRLEPPVRDRLRLAQRAWIQFRDAECALVGAPEAGGTLGPVIVDGCHVEMTAIRADQLGDLLRSQPR